MLICLDTPVIWLVLLLKISQFGFKVSDCVSAVQQRQRLEQNVTAWNVMHLPLDLGNKLEAKECHVQRVNESNI